MGVFFIAQVTLILEMPASGFFAVLRRVSTDYRLFPAHDPSG
jgi:hypothetical protein